ncbi:MAG: hypothetical protein V4671_14805 [Armatimonadota bacterium]
MQNFEAHPVLEAGQGYVILRVWHTYSWHTLHIDSEGNVDAWNRLVMRRESAEAACVRHSQRGNWDDPDETLDSIGDGDGEFGDLEASNGD